MHHRKIAVLAVAIALVTGVAVRARASCITPRLVLDLESVEVDGVRATAPEGRATARLAYQGPNGLEYRIETNEAASYREVFGR